MDAQVKRNLEESYEGFINSVKKSRYDYVLAKRRKGPKDGNLLRQLEEAERAARRDSSFASADVWASKHNVVYRARADKLCARFTQPDGVQGTLDVVHTGNVVEVLLGELRQLFRESGVHVNPETALKISDKYLGLPKQFIRAALPVIRPLVLATLQAEGTIPALYPTGSAPAPITGATTAPAASAGSPGQPTSTPTQHEHGKGTAPAGQGSNKYAIYALDWNIPPEGCDLPGVYGFKGTPDRNQVTPYHTSGVLQGPRRKPRKRPLHGELATSSVMDVYMYKATDGDQMKVVYILPEDLWLNGLKQALQQAKKCKLAGLRDMSEPFPWRPGWVGLHTDFFDSTIAEKMFSLLEDQREELFYTMVKDMGDFSQYGLIIGDPRGNNIYWDEVRERAVYGGFLHWILLEAPGYGGSRATEDGQSSMGAASVAGSGPGGVHGGSDEHEDEELLPGGLLQTLTAAAGKLGLLGAKLLGLRAEDGEEYGSTHRLFRDLLKLYDSYQQSGSKPPISLNALATLTALTSGRAAPGNLQHCKVPGIARGMELDHMLRCCVEAMHPEASEEAKAVRYAVEHYMQLYRPDGSNVTDHMLADVMSFLNVDALQFAAGEDIAAAQVGTSSRYSGSRSGSRSHTHSASPGRTNSGSQGSGWRLPSQAAAAAPVMPESWASTRATNTLVSQKARNVLGHPDRDSKWLVRDLLRILPGLFVSWWFLINFSPAWDVDKGGRQLPDRLAPYLLRPLAKAGPKRMQRKRYAAAVSEQASCGHGESADRTTR